MQWWGWALVYAAGWLFTFRTTYLRRTDARQRWLEAGGQHRVRKGDGYRRRTLTAEEAIEDREFFDGLKIFATSMLWPAVTFLLACGLVTKIVFWAMFPRGVKTKYDREKQLELEKAEQQEQYEKALQLLEETHEEERVHWSSGPYGYSRGGTGLVSVPPGRMDCEGPGATQGDREGAGPQV